MVLCLGLVDALIAQQELRNGLVLGSMRNKRGRGHGLPLEE